MKLKEIAKLVSGKVVGNGNVVIKGVAPAEEAGSGDLVFVLDEKYLALAIASRASALITSLEFPLNGKSAILVESPRLAMAEILALFAPKKKIPKGIHKTAVVPRSCKVGKNVSIGPYVVLGENVSIGEQTVLYPHTYIGDNCKVGKNCLIHSHVSLYENTRLGNRAIIHSGTRIGMDGFGFVQHAGGHLKIPQIGSVVIEDNVEIYANVCIAKATIGQTIIQEGTKIDNLCHIAHNCKIGKNCALVSLVGLSGSVTLKDHVYVAGQAGFSGHNTVGENSIILARAGVTKDIAPNSVVSGFPAQDHRKEMAFQAALRRLAKKSL
jgi:UDP-3-O-[3-hydroxymyristoyl] glucosamine N-acyltransferase